MSLANLFDLGGHVAVVTGGNGGIGRSIALSLAQVGAAVAVLARNEGKNKTVLGELKALGNSPWRSASMSLLRSNCSRPCSRSSRRSGR